MFVQSKQQTPSGDKPSDTRVVEVQEKKESTLQQEQLLQQQEKVMRLLQQKEQDLDTLRSGHVTLFTVHLVIQWVGL